MKAKIQLILFIAIPFVFVVLQYDIAFAQTDIVAKIVDTFYTKSSNWSSTLQNYALKLFNLTATLTIVMIGVKSILYKNDIKSLLGQFIMTILFCGFILAVIHNYQEWSMDIVNGLKKIAGELSAGTIDADKPLSKGYDLAKTIFNKVSMLSIGEAVGYVICALLVMVVFALMTAQIVLIKCEAFVIMNASMILLGLGGSEYFKEYAINAMRYVLSVAFKLFVMQLVMGIGLDFINADDFKDAGFQDIIIVIGVSVVLFALVKSLPDAIAGVINGSNVSSGNALGQAMTTIVTGAAAVAGGAVGGAAGAQAATSAVKNAAKLAGESGASGMGAVGHMAKSLWGAHQDSRHEEGNISHPQRMAMSVKSRLQEMKMQNAANQNDGK